MQDPIYSRIESQPRPTLTAASGFICLAVAGLWVSTLAEVALNVSGMALLNAIYYLPFVGLPLFLYARRRPGLSESLRLNPLPGLSVLSLALLGLLSVYAASALTAAWGVGLDALGLRAPGATPMPRTERELALSILTMAAFPAVCEELLFRGFVLSAWESRGTGFAIAVTAVLFALLHGNLYGLPAYLLVGAVAGFVTFALDSIYAGIAYHTLYNAACLILPYLLSSQDDTVAEMAVTGQLLFSIVLDTAVVLALMAALLATMRLRARNAGIEPIPRIRRPLSDGERLSLLAAVLAMLATMAVVLVLSARAAAGYGGAL